MFTATHTTIHDLLETAVGHDAKKEDFNVKAKDLSFFEHDNQGFVSIKDDSLGAFSTFIESVDPTFDTITRNAMHQFCTKLGHYNPRTGNHNSKLPADYLEYLKAQQPDMWATLMNRHVMDNQKDLMIRTYDNDIRAFLSNRYETIDNSQLLEVLSRVIDDMDSTQPTFKGSFINPDAMGIKSKFFERPSDHDGSFVLGVYVGNNEVGQGKVRIAPYIKRNNCNNSIIVAHQDADAVQFRHIGSDLATKVLSTVAITRCLKLADESVDKLIEGYSHVVNELDDVLAGFAKKYALPQKAQNNLLIGSAYGGGTPNTKAGIINAITYTAHASDLTFEKQEELELVAGEMLWMDHRKFDTTTQVYARAGRS